MAKPKWPAIFVCGLLLAMFAVVSMRSWWNRCCTFDEPLHLVGAFSENYLDDYRVNSEDPPLWKHFAIAGMSKDRMAFDTSSPNWNGTLTNSSNRDAFVSDTLFHTSANDADSILRDARLHMIFLGVALGILITWWSWRLAGPLAACVSCAAFALDPNFLAHSALVKNDVPMTLVFTALMAAVWLLGERATGLRCIAVAIILGVAITTKFSGSLAIPILAIALLARVASSHPWPVLRWTAVTRIQRLFAGASIGLFSFLVAWMIIWATYDFRFSPGPSPDTVTDLSDVMNACAACESIASHHNTNWDLTTAQVAQWAQDWQPGPIERTSLWINDHRLLPQSFIHGFLMTYATTLYRGSFFCGELSYFGRWYYFPAAMAFKTPLATLVALPLALFACLAEHKNIVHKVRDILASKKFWPFCAAAILPAYYMASAIHAQVNLGFTSHLSRLSILIHLPRSGRCHRLRAATAHRHGFHWGVRNRSRRRNLLCRPGLSFLLQRRRRRPARRLKLLGDSNIDWGQDLKSLVAWRKDHPEGQLALAYFGSVDPRYYNLHYFNISGSMAPDDEALGRTSRMSTRSVLHSCRALIFPRPNTSRFCSLSVIRSKRTSADQFMSTNLSKPIALATCAILLAVYAATAWEASLGKMRHLRRAPSFRRRLDRNPRSRFPN